MNEASRQPATNRRWWLAGLLCLAGMINYMDRAALSVAAPLITKDLNLDPAQLGIVFSAFSFGYAIFCFVGGWASDRFGPKRVFLVSMVVWSVFCGLTAVATTLAALLVFRVIFGMGEGPFGATVTRFVSNWFPRAEQATAIALANVGTPLGGAVAGPVVGVLALTVGWRVAFVAIAALSLVWVVVWARVSSDRPPDRGHIDPRFEPPVPAPPESRSGPTSLKAAIVRPAVLATALAFFGYSYILYFFLSWFPTYLATAQHLPIGKMAVVGAIPWVLGFLGLASGGLVSDAILRRTGDAVFSRKLILVVSLAVAAVCVALAGFASGVVAAVALTSVAVFFMYASGSLYFALIINLTDEAQVGGTMGFVHFVANCAGIVAPLATGFIVQSTGTFQAAFALAGVVAIMGATLVALVVKAPSASRRAGVARA